MQLYIFVFKLGHISDAESAFGNSISTGYIRIQINMTHTENRYGNLYLELINTQLDF